MAEVGLAGPGGHDQAVIGVLDGHPVRQVGMDHPLVEIEAVDLGQLHGHVLLAAHDVAQRGGDLSGRQHPGRRLVEQRLEQVVVAPVDQGHIDGLTAEVPGGGQAPEPAADDDHPVAAGPTGGTGSRGGGCGLLGHGRPGTPPATVPGCSA